MQFPSLFLSKLKLFSPTQKISLDFLRSNLWNGSLVTYTAYCMWNGSLVVYTVPLPEIARPIKFAVDRSNIKTDSHIVDEIVNSVIRPKYGVLRSSRISKAFLRGISMYSLTKWLKAWLKIIQDLSLSRVLTCQILSKVLHLFWRYNPNKEFWNDRWLFCLSVAEMIRTRGLWAFSKDHLTGNWHLKSCDR